MVRILFAVKAAIPAGPHNGGAPGIEAVFRRYQGSGYTLIVLSNTGMGASDVAEKIEARLYGKPVQLAVQADSDMMLALDLVMRGDLRGAGKLYDRNPSHAPSVYQAARTRIDGGYETTEAIALLNRYLGFDAAVQVAPPAGAWWRKGMAYEQLGDKAKARASYMQSLALDPAFDKAKQALAKLDMPKT